MSGMRVEIVVAFLVGFGVSILGVYLEAWYVLVAVMAYLMGLSTGLTYMLWQSRKH